MQHMLQAMPFDRFPVEEGLVSLFWNSMIYAPFLCLIGPPQVGSKTSFRLVNTNHAGWHEKKEADIQQLQSMIGLLLYVKYRKAHPNAKLFAFDPDFSTYVSSNLKVSEISRDHHNWAPQAYSIIP